MPKKNDDKSPSQMVRVDTTLWERMSEEAEKVGRTARQEIEHRLRQSLAGTPETIEGSRLGSTSAAVAIGTLAAMLTDECLEFGDTGSESLGLIRAAIFTAIGEWEPQPKLSAVKQRLAERIASALVEKVRNVKGEDAPSYNFIRDVMDGSADRRQRAALLTKIQTGLQALKGDK